MIVKELGVLSERELILADKITQLMCESFSSKPDKRDYEIIRNGLRVYKLSSGVKGINSKYKHLSNLYENYTKNILDNPRLMNTTLHIANVLNSYGTALVEDDKLVLDSIPLRMSLYTTTKLVSFELARLNKLASSL